ncbi:hypothetical protein ACSVC9_05165 [Clostridium sp. LBM24168]
MESMGIGIKHPVKGEEICSVILSKDHTLTVEDVRKYCIECL